MTATLLIEAFGSINSETDLADDTDLEAVVSDALDEISGIIGGLDQLEEIVTGMNADVTYALMDAVEERDLDIYVNAFYPDVTSIQEEDDLTYQEAWQKGFNWRNNIAFNGGDELDPVDMTVRVGDAGDNGQALLDQSRKAGIPTLDLNMDDHVDKDAAYGTEEDASEDSGENAELDEFEDNSPAVDDINGIGEKFSDRLESEGIETTADLAVETPDTLAESVEGISAERANKWISAADDAL